MARKAQRKRGSIRCAPESVAWRSCGSAGLAERGDTPGAGNYWRPGCRNGVGHCHPPATRGVRALLATCRAGWKCSRTGDVRRPHAARVLYLVETGIRWRRAGSRRSAPADAGHGPRLGPQAAVALAQIYRTGELGQTRSPRGRQWVHAFKAMELATLTDETPQSGEPFPEMAAAHLVAEMVRDQ